MAISSYSSTSLWTSNGYPSEISPQVEEIMAEIRKDYSPEVNQLARDGFSGNTQALRQLCRTLFDRFMREGYCFQWQMSLTCKCLKVAIAQGDSSAMVLLGKLHERQFASADEEYDRETGREKAILHYQRAHEAGEIDGTVSLGSMIEDQHPEKALKLYWIGDKVGHAFAKYRLANMYANGRIVDKNEKEALRLYRDAAGLGCYDAAIALSNFHRVTPPFIDLRNANRLNKFGMSQFIPFSQERT